MYLYSLQIRGDSQKKTFENFPKFHEIFARPEASKEDISKPTDGNYSLHEITNNAVGVVNLATCKILIAKNTMLLLAQLVMGRQIN
jgi:hypothetical protein